MKTLELVTVRENEYVRIRYSEEDRLIWNEWFGVIPSVPLREGMVYASTFALENDVEFILADFSKFGAPSLNDQVWIAHETAQILKDSKLKRVANVLAPDIFQQMAVEAIYTVASKVPMPCVSRDFLNLDDALSWLLEG